MSTEQSVLDAHYMARAIELARKGLYTTHPNPRVGCVIVRDGQIVGEGWHVRAGEPHAEVYALRAAGELARGATAYVTLSRAAIMAVPRRAPKGWSLPGSPAWWPPCKTLTRKSPGVASSVWPMPVSTCAAACSKPKRVP